MPMFTAKDTKTGEGVVRRVELALFANGQQIYSFAENVNARAVFPESAWRLANTDFPPIQ